MRRVASYMLQGLSAVAIVGLSPWLVTYSQTKRVTSYSEPWDTATEYRSGFPIPFMLRPNVGQRTVIDIHAFCADGALVAIAIFGACAIWNVRRLGRRSSGTGHNGGLGNKGKANV